MNDIENQIAEIAESDLTVTEAAMVLFALSKNNDAFSKLYLKVKGTDISWITDRPLREVALRLLAMKLHEPSDFNGKVTGLLVNRLIKSETTVGGPYKDRNTIETLTNVAIAQLLDLIGIKMPNLITFLKNESITELTPLEKCLLSWPNQILSIDKDIECAPEEKNIENLVAYMCLYPTKTRKRGKSTINSVSTEIEKELLSLSDPIKSLAIKMKRTVDEADKNREISLISRYFWESLPQKRNDLLPLVLEFGIANFYAWMAYSIYDDFFDDEGIPKLLPVANVAHRRSLQKYLSVSDDMQSTLILRVYDTVDSANSWEIENCRFNINNQQIEVVSIPDYKNGQILADRALGHILGPLLLAESVSDLTIIQRKNLEKGMRHYLIARQLNDDIHDWKQDIKNGHISFVVACLLKNSGITTGVYNINNLVSTLEIYFWNQGLTKIIPDVINHLDKAAENLEESGILEKDNSLSRNLIKPLRIIAEEGLTTQNNHKDFLGTYAS